MELYSLLDLKNKIEPIYFAPPVGGGASYFGGIKITYPNGHSYKSNSYKECHYNLAKKMRDMLVQEQLDELAGPIDEVVSWERSDAYDDGYNAGRDSGYDDGYEAEDGKED